MPTLNIQDLNIDGRRVLMRVDFNVPLLPNGTITDLTRLKEALPSIEWILKKGCCLILMSHLGRPKGKPEAKLSLAPCQARLSEMLKCPVKMAPDCHGSDVAKMAKELKKGEVLLLENLRFHPGEEEPTKEPSFVSGLADLGDLYINDAFASAHRAHASTTGIAQFFPGKAAMGLLMEKEITYLGSTLLNPQRPFCAILGGAKISTKFKVIQSLMQTADLLLIGGAMAYTFFKAENIAVGKSLVEDEYLGVAREILDVSTQSRCRILLPTDVVISQQITSDAINKVVQIKDGIPDDFQGVDIGPATIQHYCLEIQQSNTIFWNGPLGVFECPPFDRGTVAIAETLAHLGEKFTTIVGGGDSAAALEKIGLTEHMKHVSTGGGATLEYIEFGQLPGIEALSEKK